MYACKNSKPQGLEDKTRLESLEGGRTANLQTKGFVVFGSPAQQILSIVCVYIYIHIYSVYIYMYIYVYTHYIHYM